MYKIMKPASWLLLLVLPFVAGPILADEEHANSNGEEYVSTANVETLTKSELVSVPGKEVQILLAELPPGWIGGRHHHTGDVFVYVVDGEFLVNVEGEGLLRFGPGEVYHEAVNVSMKARNGSTAEATNLILFQVGDKGAPLMIKDE